MTELSRLARDACRTMAAAAAAVTQQQHKSGNTSQPLGGEVQQSKGLLSRAAEAVSKEVAKCALMAAETHPDTAAAKALLEALEQQVCRICAICHSLQVGGGPSLAAELHKLSKRIAEACIAFVQAAFSEQSINKEDFISEEVKRLAGEVFEQCEAAKKAPLDNRTAIGRRILHAAHQCKDVLREVRELHIESSATEQTTARRVDDAARETSTPDVSSNGHYAESDDEADVDFHPTTASSAEVKVILCIVEYVDRVLSLLKAMLRSLASRPPDLGHDVELWESVNFHIKSLSVALNDLGADLYPPQVAQEVESALEAVSLGCEMIAEELPAATSSQGVIEEAEAVSTARLSLLEAVGAL